MAIEIRDYQPADRGGVVALARELQAAEAVLYDRAKPPEEIGDWYLDMLLKNCTEHAGRIIVACDGSRLFGYASVFTEMTSEGEVDEIFYRFAKVGDLVVSVEARGTGLGRRLLAECEAIARAAEARWLRIGVLADNARAVEVYRTYGFRDFALEMEKTLD